MDTSMFRFLLPLTAAALLAQSPPPAAPKPEAAKPESDAPAQQRAAINLLGQTDTSRGESRRNENVQFNLVDNNAVKEMNIRLGATATIVGEFLPDRKYFGAELGSRGAPPIHAPSNPPGSTHGSLFWNHNNSIFSARSFFQVGDVRPARENNYGATLNTSLWRNASLSLNASQNKQRGQVNGNVLVPLAGERTPLTADPRLRPIVLNFLAAYPAGLPNRTDIAARALNTNSPQFINTDAATVQLDQRFASKDRLSLRYAFTAQNVDAFQFVAGQNPDTDTRSHSARLTWSRAWSAATTMDATAGFDRLGSLLLPAAPYGAISFSNALTSFGPSPIIPIDRAQNRYRASLSAGHIRTRHRLSFGAAVTRLQYNGEETDGHRGILSFRNDFGRDAITNLRLGTPSQLIQALGTTYRAFRNWDGYLYAGDRWQATSSLTLTYSLRYEIWTRPADITGRSNLQLDSDLNNLAPSFGFAQRLPGNAGILRGAYALHYGELFPVTYGQDRLNAPHSLRIVINQPDLADPLGGKSFEDLDPNGPSSLVEISRDLATPYSHQYNFSWESELSEWRLQLGYAGSRSHKLIMTWFLNRAVPVPGIPLISATINDRRANRNRYEHLYVLNGSRGYYDAARASVIVPRWRGLNLSVSYWFSKAIDLGTDYANTASGPDARVAVSQTEDQVVSDTRALSNFDQPHALLAQFNYETPRRSAGAARWFGGWSFSGVILAKPGTPFTVESGSDGPGFGNVDGSRGDRPHLLDPSVLGRTIGHPDDAPRRLPASAFAFIRPGEMAGNLGRNTFRKGRIANVNASLSRTLALRSDYKLIFRAESINFFNTPQFAEPTKELASPSFGQINNTLNDGRTFRLGLRFDF